jgi:DNA-binding response OmpR family regulator
MKILIVEDEVELAQSLKEELSSDYIVEVTHAGKEGQYLGEVNTYDLIILDLVLPDMGGIEVCQSIRKCKVTTPILMLTGKSEVDNKVLALDAGADDYLVKPFNLKELKARIRALTRRKNAEITSHVLIIGDLSLDTLKRCVKRGNTLIELRRKEYDQLEYLMRNAGKVVTREMILDHVWENSYDAYSNTVDVHLKYLRDRVDKPFPKKLIKTVHGMGYRIVEDDM